MRRQLSIAALLLVSGCGLFRAPGPQLPAEVETPDTRACHAEARNSPAVVELYRQMNPSNQFNVDRMQGEVRRAEYRDYRDCLRARGASDPGGVEAQVPR